MISVISITADDPTSQKALMAEYLPEDKTLVLSIDGYEQPYTFTITESETAPVLRELLTTKDALPPGSKRLFSFFIANMALRAPANIQETGETGQQEFSITGNQAFVAARAFEKTKPIYGILLSAYSA